MTRSSAPVALTLALLAFAGCIQEAPQPYDEEKLEPSDFDDEPILFTTTVNKEADVTGIKVPAGDDEEAASWTIEIPTTVNSMNATLTWPTATNEYRLTVTDSEGNTENFPSGDGETRIDANITEALAGGTTTFTAYKRSGITEERIHLSVSYSWLDEPGALPAITVEEMSNGQWKATRQLSSETAVGSHMQLDVDVLNGNMLLNGEPRDKARATLSYWATGNSREDARTNLLSAPMQFRMDREHLLINLERPDDYPQREQLGAHVIMLIPATVSGTIDSSNGNVDIEHIKVERFDSDSSNGYMQFTDVEMDDGYFDSSNGPMTLNGVIAHGNSQITTSNGKITGDVQAGGSLLLDTSNGDVDLDLTPLAALDLEIDTSNGDVDMRLKEGSTISYDLEVDTSNGKVTESMSEAEFHATDDDEDEGTLETEGSSRSKHVSGTIDSSNGDIHFAGA